MLKGVVGIGVGFVGDGDERWLFSVLWSRDLGLVVGTVVKKLSESVLSVQESFCQ